MERPLAGEQSIVKEPGFFEKIGRILTGNREREVACFTCGHKQVLNTAAHSSMCPACGAYIDLRDFHITTPFARSVQTAGEVHIGPKGTVTSSKIMCGSCIIEGSLRGYIVCNGTVTLRTKERVSGGIETDRLLVDKKADVDLARTLKARIFEVKGKVRARVIADRVIITKGGVLEGSVFAKAITVDKGGIFSGDLTIGQDSAETDEPEEEDDESEEDDEDEEEEIEPKAGAKPAIKPGKPTQPAKAKTGELKLE